MTRGIVVASAVAMVSLWSTASRADSAKVAADTYVSVSMPAQNNGSDATVSVRNIGAGGIRQGYVRFDLSALAPSLRVSRATLRLWVADVEDPGSIEVRLASGPWQELSLTAANAPAPGALLGTRAIALTDRKKFVTVDITSAVADWLSGATVNTGLVIAPNPADQIRVAFDTKENTGTSHPAEIEIASAADITSVAAGSGLTGGGASGDVILGLRTDCAAGTVLRWDGGSWTCAIVPGGGGTVTQVNSGAGLVGGPITGSGTLRLDTAYTDARYLERSMAFSGSAVTVDCDAGQTIGAALNGAVVFGHLAVTVLGTCKELVQIKRSDTDLIGGATGATIESPTAGSLALWVVGARVRITGLTVRGGTSIGAGAYVSVSASRFTGSTGPGIFVPGGTLVLEGSTVDETPIGILAWLGSIVELYDSTVENNQTGIVLMMNTSAVVEGSRIRNNSDRGLGLSASAAEVIGSTIERNATGISARGGARIFLSGNTAIHANQVGIDLQDVSLAMASATTISDSASIGVSCAAPPGTALLVGSSQISFQNNGTDTNCPSY